MTTADRDWPILKEVFGAALALPAADREEFLAERCATNQQLRERVRGLLEHHEGAGDFLQPVVVPGGDRQDVPAARDDSRTEGEPPLPPGAELASAPGIQAAPRHPDPAGSSSASPSAGPSRAAQPIGALVAGRYRLGECLGGGASGRVYRARDLLSERQVALKLLESERLSSATMLREVAMLRHSRFPGIVRTLDDGHDGDFAFIVMELIAGRPFPGRALPVPWSALAPAAVTLCESLSFLHSAGLLHRDLKPANVLVDAAGRTTLVDLGLAWDLELDGDATGTFGLAGTPAYLAPELLAGLALSPGRAPAGREEPEAGLTPAAPSIRSDLYAVGVMLHEALVGRRLHAGLSLEELLEVRGAVAPVSVQRECPDLPSNVATAVDRLLAIDPARRPESALEVLRLLRAGRALPAAPLRRGAAFATNGDGEAGLPTRPSGSEELEPIFLGHQRIHHVPEDAAALLWERTAGAPERLRDELDAWVRDGLARVEDSDGQTRFAIDRLALDHARLQPGQGLEQLITAGDLTELPAAARDLGRQYLHDGHPGAAAAVLREGLAALRRAADGTGKDEGELLLLLLEASLNVGSREALNLALYEATRTRLHSQRCEQVLTLARGALLVVEGNRARALTDLSEPLARPEDPIERMRFSIRALAVRGCPVETEREVLGEIVHWARRYPGRDARVMLFKLIGWRRYRQGRFLDAARCHRKAGAWTNRPQQQLSALLDAASAYLEGGALEEAEKCALAGRALAAGARQPHYEARAEWLVRCAAYRRDPTQAGGLEPDLELLEAVRALRVDQLTGLVSFMEGAIAWRRGQLPLGRRLALAAATSLGAAGRADLRALALSLASAAGEPLTATHAGELMAQARGCPLPGVALQIATLYHPRAGESAPELARIVRRQEEQIRHHQSCPGSSTDRPLEVLTVEEALAAVASP